MGHKFHPHHRARLDSEERLRVLDPEGFWQGVGLAQGETVADVGCGTGAFTLPAARIVGPGGIVFALDIAGEMVATVRERALAAGLDNVRAMVAGETSLPLGASAVERVLAALVVHEVAPGDRAAFAAELARILRPGGYLHVLEWQQRATLHGPPVAHRLSPGEVAAVFPPSTWELAHREDRGNDYYHLGFMRLSAHDEEKGMPL